MSEPVKMPEVVRWEHTPRIGWERDIHGEWVKHEEFDAFASAHLATVAALEAENKRLREYAQHKPECAMREWHNSSPHRVPCDCGFAALGSKP